MVEKEKKTENDYQKEVRKIREMMEKQGYICENEYYTNGEMKWNFSDKTRSFWVHVALQDYSVFEEV